MEHGLPLPEISGYNDNGIAIYTPEQAWNEHDAGAYSMDDSAIAAVITAAMIEGRPIYNETGRPIQVPVLLTLTTDGKITVPMSRAIYG